MPGAPPPKPATVSIGMQVPVLFHPELNPRLKIVLTDNYYKTMY